MSQRRAGQYRIYEGEWLFCCQTNGCRGYAVEYLLNDYESGSEIFLDNCGYYKLADCPICSNGLEWADYGADSPISDGWLSLLEGRHFMAAIVILASISEMLIQNLLWAALVDSGVEPSRANSIADSKLGRSSMIDLINKLTDLRVPVFSFPARNQIAHGRGLAKGNDSYRSELVTQIRAIDSWVSTITTGQNLSNLMPTECQRWLIFTRYWANWLGCHAPRLILGDDSSE